MKKVLLFFIIINLAIANCRTLSPISETDVAVNMILNRKIIKHKAQYDLSTFAGGWDMDGVDGEAGVIILGVIAVVLVGEIAVNILQGCDVYVYPEGYREQYIQQLYWGENRVFLPRKFIDSGGSIYFEVKGSYEGDFTQKFIPGNAFMVIGNSKLQEELNTQLKQELKAKTYKNTNE